MYYGVIGQQRKANTHNKALVIVFLLVNNKLHEISCIVIIRQRVRFFTLREMMKTYTLETTTKKKIESIILAIRGNLASSINLAFQLCSLWLGF